MREKRAHQRTSYVVPVEVLLPSGDTHGATTRDLSLGGIFLETETVVGIGVEVSIKLELPGLGVCKLPGFVRWVTAEGYGIQFGLLGARETHSLGKLLRSAETEF